MIKLLADGTTDVYFEDWTPMMMALSSRLFKMPLVPGRTVYRHEIGIDKIARWRYGYVAIELLYRYLDELDYCPNEAELQAKARSLLAMVGEVELIRRASRRPPRPRPLPRLRRTT